MASGDGGLSVLRCRDDVLGTTMDSLGPVTFDDGNIHIWRALFPRWTVQ